MSYSTSIGPRETQPNLAPLPRASNTASVTATKSARADFSVARTQSVATANSANPIHIARHQGAPLFSEGFSRNFGRAYASACAVLQSPSSIKHYEEHGKFSPEDAQAIYRLVSIVALKSGDDHAQIAARLAHREDKLTSGETAAWMNFINRLPEHFKNEMPPSAQWKPVGKTELREVLCTDSAFAKFINEPEGIKFVDELVNAINNASAQMGFTDKGLSFTLHFAHAYGSINHIAAGTFWRDDSGQLKMQLIHQESFPPTKATGNIAVGRVYSYLDTTEDHPEKKGTMVESMKLAGMPAVNLFPCPAPEMLEPFTRLLHAVGLHPYGPMEDWNDNNKGNLMAARAFECCFDVTVRALYVVNNLMAERVHLLPDHLERMQYLASIPVGQFDTVNIPGSKGQRTVRIKDINTLPFKDRYAVFKAVGSAWGRNMLWDVNPQTTTEQHTLTIQAKEKGIFLKPGQRLKFVQKPNGLMLDGKQVQAEKTYTNEEARRMNYAGEKSLSATIIVATPTGTQQASL
jgi:hypothetical protein